MERWQLWSGFFYFALLVLLQKATREANDNKIEHLWECSVDHNHSQLPLCPKSLHNSPIFPSGLAYERGNYLESLIDLPWILRILRNLSVIPKSYLWKNQCKNQREITFGLCPDSNKKFWTKIFIWVMTKLLHHVYFKYFELIYAFRAEILISFFKKPALSLPPLPTGGTKISQ